MAIYQAAMKYLLGQFWGCVNKTPGKAIYQAAIKYGLILQLVFVRQNIMHFIYPIGQFWGWYRTVPHAAADYGRDWSTGSGVTPSHMQEVGSLVSRRRIELNQPGKVVVKINVIIKWVVVAPSKTFPKQVPRLDLIQFFAHQQSWA
jgi:hypothetical protein